MISYTETELIGEIQQAEKDVIINLITIYDKADSDTISDKELRELIKAFHLEG